MIEGGRPDLYNGVEIESTEDFFPQHFDILHYPGASWDYEDPIDFMGHTQYRVLGI